MGRTGLCFMKTFNLSISVYGGGGGGGGERGGEGGRGVAWLVSNSVNYGLRTKNSGYRRK